MAVQQLGYGLDKTEILFDSMQGQNKSLFSKAYHSAPYNAQIKSEWSNTSTVAIHLLDV